jgi:AAA15 family ATPase/GTPase
MVLFHNPRFNPKNAQLICTTHHSSLLASDLLRRDQIWFAEKDGEGASHYYSLLDYSPRKDKALMKGYLSGEYGAVPDLAALDSLLKQMEM